MTSPKLATRIERVLVQIAMHDEAEPIAERLGLDASTPLHERLPATVRSGRVGAIAVDLVVHGVDPVDRVDRIGTESATLVAFLACDRFRPDLLVNAGTCGGFEARDGRIGEVVLASRFAFHDQRIALPGFDAFGEARRDAFPNDGVAALLGVRRGPVTTGSSLDETEAERARFDAEGALAKEMEAAAIARVAADLDVPFLALKGVTDLVDHHEPAHEAFLRNLARTVDAITDDLERLLTWLGEGRTLDEVAHAR